MFLSADTSSTLDRILDAATDNLRVAKILIQMGLDPNNVTWDAIFNRLLEIFGAVGGAEHDVVKALPPEKAELIGQERLALNGQKRFGCGQRQRM